MTETRIGFLCNAASFLLQSENNSTKTILRSYYLMRCDEIAKTAELPNRYFSPKVRCPQCYIEWNSETIPKVKSRKISKQQRRRLRLKAVKNKDPSLLNELSNKKELEQICSFCQHKTNTPLVKLNKEKEVAKVPVPKDNNKDKNNIAANKVALSNPKKKTKESFLNSSSINVYASSKDIFSLKNSDNTLKSTVKVEAKVIKNNKKKKDKFAGLCQKAVLATTKLKEDQKKQNKLNLFLKPSV